MQDCRFSGPGKPGIRTRTTRSLANCHGPWDHPDGLNLRDVGEEQSFSYCGLEGRSMTEGSFEFSGPCEWWASATDFRVQGHT